MSRSRNWCFTLNTPESNELPPHADLRYAVWQLERGASGTAHLQGYAEFSKPMRLNACKSWLPTAHFEPRRGTRQQAVTYCKKDDSRLEGPWERGSFVGDGQRTDLEVVRDSILAGTPVDEVIDDNLSLYARCPHVFRYYKARQSRAAAGDVDMDIPRVWQADVLRYVARDPHPRQILWIVDENGNTGKTHLAKHLVKHKGAFYCTGGKKEDSKYAYQGERIACFDFARDSREYVQYSLLEEFKNGIYFSSKYESAMRHFPQPHVLVFANFEPDYDKLSADRWLVMRARYDFTFQCLKGTFPSAPEEASPSDVDIVPGTQE